MGRSVVRLHVRKMYRYILGLRNATCDFGICVLTSARCGSNGLDALRNAELQLGRVTPRVWMIVPVMLLVPPKLITRFNTIVPSTFVHRSAIVLMM
jgi:hypothetical protein